MQAGRTDQLSTAGLSEKIASLKIPGAPINPFRSSSAAEARPEEKTSGAALGDWLSRFVVAGNESDPSLPSTVGKRFRHCKWNPRPKELIFNSRFEGGNLGRVEKLSDYEYDLYIQSDSGNPRHRMWFNFCVSNVRKRQRILFNIVNLSKSTSLFSKGMTPLVQSSSRPFWTRIPKKQVYYYRNPALRRKYVLTVAFAFDNEDDIYQFAYAYPYTYQDLQQFLVAMERMNHKFFRREVICTTSLRNNIDLVTITSPHNLAGGKTVKTVLITARVHPGETPSSFVVEGLMEFLLGRSVEAQMLRDNIMFKIVPMINPDGVTVGNYRCALNGEDLNRHWTDPSVRGDISIHALKRVVHELEETRDLKFCVDLHAHSSQLNCFTYGNVYQGEEQMLEEAVFPRLFSANTPDFSWSQTSFNYDVVKSGTSRRYLGWCMGSGTHCYTLEVSFYGYKEGQGMCRLTAGKTPSGGSKIIPYTPESYRRLGQNLGHTFVDYYNLSRSKPRTLSAAAATSQPESLSRHKGSSSKSEEPGTHLTS